LPKAGDFRRLLREHAHRDERLPIQLGSFEIAKLLHYDDAPLIHIVEIVDDPAHAMQTNEADAKKCDGKRQQRDEDPGANSHVLNFRRCSRVQRRRGVKMYGTVTKNRRRPSPSYGNARRCARSARSLI
jgi:hypothetical protein